jgi:hypothetical protein
MSPLDEQPDLGPRATHAVRSPEARRCDKGAGALGLLATVAVLAAISVAVISSVPGAGTVAGIWHAGHGGGRLTTPSGSARKTGAALRTVIGSAAVQACRADYQVVEVAVGYYEAEDGSPPRSVRALDPWLHRARQSPGFNITIDPHHPGLVEVAAEGRSPSPGEANCAYAR